MLSLKFWDRYFKVYDNLNRLSPYRSFLADVCDGLKVKKGDNVLDAGCGTGNLCLEVKKRKAKAVCLDFSKSGLEEYLKKDPKGEVILHSLTEKLPFSSNYFDKIACADVVYTIEESKRLGVLKELNRVLRPGGLIALADPKKGFNPFSIYFGDINKVTKEHGHRRALLHIAKTVIPAIRILFCFISIRKDMTNHFFTTKEHKDILLRAGFSEVVSESSTYHKQCVLHVAKK